MTQPLRYDASATLLADGHTEVVLDGQTLQVDATGDAAAFLPQPANLLAAAFASCLLKSLERSATQLRFRYRDASVRVVVQRHGTPPSFSRIEYELELDTEERPGRVDLVERNLLRFGPVTSTLAQVCEIEGRVKVREPAAS